MKNLQSNVNVIFISGKQRMQKWLRGHCAIVNSAGFIRYWAPMFKSEGPAQIALIVLTFLLTILAPGVPPEEWYKLGWLFCLVILAEN